MATSDEMDELTLLERVFLRIGSAETDEQLQTALAKFLSPVLLKLASQQEGVRKKVMELLVHINKRVKSRPKIQLPVEALLTQYQDPAASPFVTNFTILYIKMGFPRMTTEKKVDLVPTLLNCMESKPQPQQDSLLQLITPVLGDIKMPGDPEEKKRLYGLSERPSTAKLLLDFLMDVLLLPYSANHDKPDSSGGSQGAAAAAKSTRGPPAGLSEAAYKRVCGEAPLLPDDLEKVLFSVFLLGREAQMAVFPQQRQ